jgi:hypothetical protein
MFPPAVSAPLPWLAGPILYYLIPRSSSSADLHTVLLVINDLVIVVPDCVVDKAWLPSRFARRTEQTAQRDRAATLQALRYGEMLLARDGIAAASDLFLHFPRGPLLRCTAS